MREQPRVYRREVELLAEPNVSINQITKLCRVSEHTVRAVREREAIEIADRKQRLVSIFGNVAEIAAERMEELARKELCQEGSRECGWEEQYPANHLNGCRIHQNDVSGYVRSVA